MHKNYLMEFLVPFCFFLNVLLKNKAKQGRLSVPANMLGFVH